MSSGTTGPPLVKAVSTQDAALLEAVIELGNKSRQTLGQLPYAVFTEATMTGTLLAAIRNDRLVGYALFSLPRQIVSLTHLCVDEEVRGGGVARRLVTEISARHRDRFGIRAKCRRDYGLDGLWWKLGFTPRGEVAGRGVDPRRLTVWWLDHGHHDLFAQATDDALLSAAIDLNILIDLDTPAARPAATESQVLLADHLTGQLELVTTPALASEINGITDLTSRMRCFTAVGRFPERHGPRDDADRMMHDLTTAVALRTPGFPRTTQDEFDARHIAEAAAASVRVVVTRDRGMRVIFDEIAQREFGVRVLSPADVVVRVDELARAAAYQPARLFGTSYELVRLGVGGEATLSRLLDRGGGERRTAFAATLQGLATSGCQRFVVRLPDSQPAACYAHGAADGVLTVPFLRVAEHPLARTLARQLLFVLRTEARTAGCSVLRLTDPHLAPAAREAAVEDGFRQRDAAWTALVIDRCAAAAEVDATARDAAAAVGLLELPRLRPELTAPAAAEAERLLWPAKIIDSQLPTMLIPVRPSWSADLFGVPATATARPTLLGISREHVYFRPPARIETPARLLWYATLGQSDDGVGGVVACSMLEQAVVDSPERMFGRFRHLGALSLAGVRSYAKDDKVQALRFVDTEVLPRPVQLRTLRRLAGQDGHTIVVRSAQKISRELFAAIYREGRDTS